MQDSGQDKYNFVQTKLLIVSLSHFLSVAEI